MFKNFYIILTTLLIILPYSIASAQQNPPGINWKEIDTGTYRIIFPAKIESMGQYVANLMTHYEKYNYKSMITRPRKIPIVLINQYSQANGFVSLAPFYSHWFTTPSSLNSIEWIQGLAIHEGRHMAQINKLKDGPGKGAWKVLAGPMGTAIFQFFYVPSWFMEGDAVVMETALSLGGRGRLPYFDLWHRGIELSGIRYSYYKSYLGTDKSLYPYTDHYRLGYLISSYVRKHYGLTIWDRVLERTGKYFLFPTFDSALKSETGKSIQEIYHETMNEYRSMWIEQKSQIKIIKSSIESPPSSNSWNSYLYPRETKNNTINVLHFTKENPISLIEIKHGKIIKEIKQLPFSVASSALCNERSISFGGNFALWKEEVPDIRWQYRTWSDLKLLNMQTGKVEFLTNYGKILSSAISNDGKLAVAIDYGLDLTYRIKTINTLNKNITGVFKAEKIGHIYDPSISDDKTTIVFAVLSTKGNALFSLERLTGKFKKIIDYTFSERIKSPVFSGKYIFYGSDYSGIDNIYALDTVSGKRYQVTSRPLGAYFPSPSADNRVLFFNDYSINGFSVSSMKLKPSNWIPIDEVKPNPLNYIKPIVNQELNTDKEKINQIPDKKYKVNDYNYFSNAINIYGWLPFFNSSDTNFYFSIISRDILHTIDTSLSYIYNFNENTNAISANFIYSGLYPIVTATGTYGKRAIFLEEENRTSKEIKYSTWNEKTVSGTISLPCNFSRGIHSTNIDISAEGGYINITNKDNENYLIYNDIPSNGNLKFASYSMNFNHKVQGTLSGIGPKYGQILNISFTHTPWECDYKSKMFNFNSKLYFPGFKDTHSLFFTGAYEYIDYENYLFPQKFLFPRGYKPVRYEKFFKGGIDYSMPLLDVSLSLWKLSYIKRFNGTVFYDYGAGILDGNRTIYRSTGFEITAKQNLLFNMYLLTEIGFRYSRCLNTNETRYDFIVKTTL